MEGLIDGGVNVFDDETLVSYCHANLTDIPDAAKDLYDAFLPISDVDMDTVLGNFETFTDDINGAIYNCFFSVVTPGKAAGYTTAFTK